MAKEEDYSWLIMPLIGAASLIGAFLFSSNNNSLPNNNNLPPPPNQKPSGCGCNHK